MGSRKTKRKETADRPPKPSSLRWVLLAFAGLSLLALIQYLWQADLCKDGTELPAKIKAITLTSSEDHEYGRSLKIYNVELGYTVAGKLVSVIKTFNDGEAGGLFSEGAVVGDTVLILVVEEDPKRFKLRSECG